MEENENREAGENSKNDPPFLIENLVVLSQDMSESSTALVTANTVVEEPQAMDFHQKNQWKHSISIIQEPTKARMCGINTPLGKRLLDPPLVIQLHLHQSASSNSPTAVPGENSSSSLPIDRDPHHHTTIMPQGLAEKTFVCIVSLCNAGEEFSLGFCKSIKELYARDGSFKTRIAGLLIGQTCKMTSFYAIASGNEPLPMFVFHDLAIRLNGLFRLKCTCVNLSTGQTEIAYTNTFQVFVPQSFPGLDEPTKLSKVLYTQGVPIRAGLHSNAALDLARRILSSPEKSDIPLPKKNRKFLSTRKESNDSEY